ncbi:MAG: type II/IV secretion system protein [Leptolyngbyaceae cyanobacterium SL_1_1]|nr:type II/IV secretion system protein [Leptolyngbyaceae cyanobacterium RM2_2_21]NJN04057.1 type II/IV secretion system protein [Leptolyngbyaceae cyanobacterium RM1_1_2]NJO09729.1 type II/IV secretion system protein [Leptolyngbyaceae cyanobacterium SL_1_1]
MQSVPQFLSAWKQLKKGKLTCEEAIRQLIYQQGKLDLALLDEEVSQRFFQLFPDRKLPPVVPLLLWQNCYYLGSPLALDDEDLRKLSDRTQTRIQVVPIAPKCYRAWHHTRHYDPSQIFAGPLIDPLTGEQTSENISETTELSLAKADGQIERIKTIISSALRNRASDIHLEPVPDGLRVRYRIDGVLRDITRLPIEISRRVVVALKVMADMDISDSRRPQDGRIGEQYALESEADLGMDMRVSTLPCVGGEKAVVRLLPRRNPFSTIDKLGFEPKTLEAYKTWLQQPQGMIIFTGPTGSGKTSTLYTSLQEIATEHVNVVTVEDPVEYVLPRITQTQVNEAAGMTFAAGLRSILRQDPDIIMVGEIRDHETAETAVRAALTGHLVFTTLHTNDAVGAIPRIKDIGPDPGLISDALLGVIAQRLIRRVCPHCAESYLPAAEDLAVLGLDQNRGCNANWQRGQGCDRCFQSGYLGREAVVELLEIDDRVRELIYEGTISQLHRYLHKIGFMSFRLAAIEKILAGKTTVEEVIRVLPRSALTRATTNEADLQLVQKLG